MRISVLITYYNQKDFVHRSLASVLKQKCKRENLEILIGDDGSTDGTSEVLREYKKQYPGLIRVITRPRDAHAQYDPRVRVGKNRANLLRESSGDFFCFLDGDDFYINDLFLVKGLAALLPEPSLAGCAFDFASIYSNNIINPISYGKSRGIINLAGYLPGRYLHAGGILFRKPTLDSKFEWLASKGIFSDNFITFYMLNHGNIYYLPDEHTYGYYQNKHGIWSGNSSMEKDITNAMFASITRKLLPNEFCVYAMQRFAEPIQSVYGARKELYDILGPEKIALHSHKAKYYGAGFVLSLLNWHSLNLQQQTRVNSYYASYMDKIQVAGKKRVPS